MIKLKCFLFLSYISSLIAMKNDTLSMYKFYDVLEKKTIGFSKIQYQIENLITTIDDASLKSAIKQSDDQLKNVTETLLILKIYEIPKDIILLTISKLHYFQGIDIDLLAYVNLKQLYVFIATKNQVSMINEIHTKNWTHIRYCKDEFGLRAIKNIVDGEALRYDFKHFVKAYPHALQSLNNNNLAYKIYNNYYDKFFMSS